MSVRAAMYQRTTVQRRTETSDTGGGYTDTWANTATSIPCRAYSMRIRAGISGVTGMVGGVVMETPGTPGTRIRELVAALVPKGTDVQEGDRLVSVTDRLGNIIFTGPLNVDSVGEYLDHLRLTIRRID